MPEIPPLPEPPPEEARENGWTAPIADLLQRPGTLPPAGRLLALVAAGCALYGFAAGFFQGGGQLAWSALKAPLVVLGALLLCIPSFVVFQLVAGTRATTVALVRAGVGFAAVTAVFLAALAPIGWLFSATSASLAFVVIFHLVIWGVALGFGLRYLISRHDKPAARGVSWLWSILFWLVAVQLATYLGPMLVHQPGEARFAFERLTFFTRCEEAFNWDLEQRLAQRALEREAAESEAPADPDGELPGQERP